MSLQGSFDWGIENASHWSLDVTFREDDSRVRERVLGNNVNWLYRFTLSILEQHPDPRDSLVMRRRLCGWSEKFPMEIINVLGCLCALALGHPPEGGHLTHLRGEIPSFGKPAKRFGVYQEHHVEDRDALAGHGRTYDLTVLQAIP